MYRKAGFWGSGCLPGLDCRLSGHRAETPRGHWSEQPASCCREHSLPTSSDDAVGLAPTPWLQPKAAGAPQGCASLPLHGECLELFSDGFSCFLSSSVSTQTVALRKAQVLGWCLFDLQTLDFGVGHKLTRHKVCKKDMKRVCHIPLLRIYPKELTAETQRTTCTSHIPSRIIHSSRKAGKNPRVYRWENG